MVEYSWSKVFEQGRAEIGNKYLYDIIPISYNRWSCKVSDDYHEEDEENTLCCDAIIELEEDEYFDCKRIQIKICYQNENKFSSYEYFYR